MGKLEKELHSEIRRTKIVSAIIAAVGAVGIVSVAVLAPNALQAFAGNKYLRQKKYRFKSSLSRLISRGYLTLIEEGDKKRIRLTPKGERYAALLGEGKLALKKPRRWDGKWRMLIFDIPERRRNTRVRIRATLISLGFLRLQDSVWVYPYDCEDFITMLKADLKVGKDLLYVIADKIEYDAPLREHFGFA
jgi:DNA-binding transcriptional regulator PaaX